MPKGSVSRRVAVVRQQQDADTVFQLASKSNGRRHVVAHAVTDNVVTWDTPVVMKPPRFPSRDPYVTGQANHCDPTYRSGHLTMRAICWRIWAMTVDRYRSG